MDNIFDIQEIVALLYFIICWVGYTQYADHKSRHSKSLLAVTNEYRTQWMHEMIRRDHTDRSMDAISIGNLQRSITFFANTTIFILIGLLTMLGHHDLIDSVINILPFAKETTPLMWEMKIFLLIIIFIYAFFKYTWSLRQYNYAGIFVSAVPPYKECIPHINELAAKGGYLVGNAARHFNNGLRAYYFGLAALSWFIHPFLFMAVTTLIVFVTHRREYHSATLKNLAR